MCLAARFPLKSETDNKSCCTVGTENLVEKPEVGVVNQDNIMISPDKILSYPTYHRGFVPMHDTSGHWRNCEASRKNMSLAGPSNQRSNDEIIMSQDSHDHSFNEVTQGVSSSSGSNSEAEILTTGCEQGKTQLLNLANSAEAGKMTLFQEFYSSVNGVSLFDERTKDGQVLQSKQNSRSGEIEDLISHSASNHLINFGNSQKRVPEVYSADSKLYDFEALGMLKTSQTTGPETIPLINKLQDTDYRRVSIQDVGESVDKLAEKQYGPIKFPHFNPYEPLSVHVGQMQDNSSPGSGDNHPQPLSGHHHSGEKISKPNGMPFKEFVSTTQKLSTGQCDSVKSSTNMCNHMEGFPAEKGISEVNGQAHSNDRIDESKAHEQLCTSDTSTIESKQKVPKSRKIKPETETAKKVNWDDLRKQAQVNGIKKERSKDAMDSLDYEALRHASVKEISETIRERGMNNMLAERMKVCSS